MREAIRCWVFCKRRDGAESRPTVSTRTGCYPAAVGRVAFSSVAADAVKMGRAYFEIGQWREDLLSNSVGERPPALDLLLAILEDLAPGSSDRRERISLIVLAVGSGRGAAAVVSPGESEGSDGLAVARAARLARGKPGEGDDGPKRIRARVECPGPLRQKLELIRAARDIQEE
jgi:hypothetical protein